MNSASVALRRTELAIRHLGEVIGLPAYRASPVLLDPAGMRLERYSSGRITEAHLDFERMASTGSNFKRALSFYGVQISEDLLDPCL